MKNIKEIKNKTELKNTNNSIKKDGGFLIFFSPHCGHCQMLEPELKKLDSKLNSHVIKKPIRKVSPDFIEDVHTSGVYIQGVPTMMVVNNKGQEVSTFDGSRTSDNILEFLKKNKVVEKKGQKAGNSKKRKSLHKKRKTLRSKRLSFNKTRRKLK